MKQTTEVGMLQFREITIQDKALVESYTKPKQIRLSYYNFTNLFTWRNHSNYRICEHNGFLIVAGRFRDYQFCFCPIGEGDFKQTLSDILEHFGGAIDFFPLTSWMKDEIEAALSCKFTTSESRSQFDYVYEREALATLKGKKLHAKRNYVNRFKKLYNYEYRPLDDSLFEECLRFSERWWENQQAGERASERGVIRDTLRYFNELGLRGGAILVDGQIVAYSVGEKMTEDTALIHLEKADTNYQGAYAIINQAFVENAFPDVTYIDREEDMGIEGLRKAKLSYYPCELIPVYRIEVQQ
jgi:hypothetical protein